MRELSNESFSCLLIFSYWLVKIVYYHCILTLFRLFNTCNTRFYEKLIFDKRSRYMYFRKESIDPWYELNASETLNYWIEETFKFHGLMHEDNGILITNSTCSWTLSDASVFKVPVPWGLWNLEASLNVHLAQWIT